MYRSLGHVLTASALVAAVPLGGVANAQQAVTVAGRVTATNTQLPLGAVQVFIPSLNVGAQTRDDGSFSFTVPSTAVGQTVAVTARRVGYKSSTQSVTLRPGTTALNLSVEASATQLSTVVVTALGQQQQRAAVTTSIQQVGGEQLAAVPTPNLVNALSGKVSGVQITGSTTQGGSSRIVIRGANSISGNNQPLFIVDGVPVLNSSVGSPTGYGGKDYGNAIQDLNPEDIENISVLKGPNAAALYGSRAANGAVVITTKSGRNARGGLQVQATANATADIPKVPEFQNQYGQGAGGEYKYVDGLGNGINDDVDESWGPKLDGRLIDQWFGKQQPWVAHPNNVDDFFRTGATLLGTAAVSGSTDRAQARLSANTEQIRGIVPNNSIRKTGVAFNGTIDATSRLTFNTTGNYIQSGGLNRPGTGYGTDNIMEQFGWFARQTDMDMLRTYKDSTGAQRNWISRYHNNPFWIQYENNNVDQRDRLIGQTQGTYRFTPWLSLMGRTGIDWYRENRQVKYAGGTIGFATSTLDPNWNGSYDLRNIYQREVNSDVLLTAKHDITRSFNVTANLGGARRNASYRNDAEFTPSLVARGLYTPANSAVPVQTTTYFERKIVNSVYGSAQVGFRDYVFVEATGRNDVSSTLPKANNSYFYPSVSGSFVASQAFPRLTEIAGGAISNLKLRGGWARVGNDADPYQLITTVTAQTQKLNAQPQYYVGDVLANRDLKPEQTESREGGVELGLFNERVTLDGTIYSKATTNQILSAQISAASGFGFAAVNAGRVTNRGVELQLGLVPVRTSSGFEWTSTINYGQNKNRVEELVPGKVDAYNIGTYWNAYVQARAGQPYGTIFGYAYLRDVKGNVVIGADGVPKRNDVQQVLGSYPARWTGSLFNSLRYKRATVSALVDASHGGRLLSIGNMFNTSTGVYTETLKGREADDYFVVPGVVCAAADTKRESCTPNTTKVSAETYWHGLTGQYLHEAFTYDASFVKLREVRVGFDLPRGLLGNVARFQSANIAFIGRNLLTHDNVPHIDAETSFQAGNLQGIEYGQLPLARSFGVAVSFVP